MNTRIISRAGSFFLAIMGAYLLIGLILASGGDAGVFFILPSFFYSVYLQASFLLPVYVIFFSVLLLQKTFRPALLLTAVYSLLSYFLLAFFLRFLSVKELSQIEIVLANSLSRIGCIVLSFTGFLFSLVFLPSLYSYLKKIFPDRNLDGQIVSDSQQSTQVPGIDEDNGTERKFEGLSLGPLDVRGRQTVKSDEAESELESGLPERPESIPLSEDIVSDTASEDVLIPETAMPEVLQTEETLAPDRDEEPQIIRLNITAPEETAVETLPEEEREQFDDIPVVEDFFSEPEDQEDENGLPPPMQAIEMDNSPDIEPEMEADEEVIEIEPVKTKARAKKTVQADEDDTDGVEADLPKPVVHQRVEKRIADYKVPVEKLLHDYGNQDYWHIDKATQECATVLKQTLEEFNIQAEVTGIIKGPVITMYEILPAPGVKLSKIVNLADNIALRLAASRLRIVAPIPGRHAVGIEVPNKKRAVVSFKEIITDEAMNDTEMAIPVVLGKDIAGEAQFIDLTQTPHLLIAGATGSGKSVCVNNMICSILYKRSPDQVKLMLIDPKIVELKFYNGIPHLLTPVITDPKKAFQAIQYCLSEMERRYALLDSVAVRDIKSYNKKIKTKKLATLPLPYIVVIVDEFADLMATTGKELEAALARLAAMSRAVGIHLVLATQRPSIEVITGLIKANIPTRIAFMVAGKFDSRIIIDANGAEKLLGKGDMLFSSSAEPVPKRIQGAFLSDEEVEKITEHVKSLGEPEYIDDEIFFDEDENDDFQLTGDDYDPMMDKALEIIAMTGKASASYLQRRLKIGYNRSARIIEEFEARGILGPANGSKPRELLHMPDKAKA